MPSPRASRRTVCRWGVVRAPRSRSCTPRAERPARSASDSWVSPAARRWRRSRAPNGTPSGAAVRPIRRRAPARGPAHVRASGARSPPRPGTLAPWMPSTPAVDAQAPPALVAGGAGRPGPRLAPGGAGDGRGRLPPRVPAGLGQRGGSQVPRSSPRRRSWPHHGAGGPRVSGWSGGADAPARRSAALMHGAARPDLATALAAPPSSARPRPPRCAGRTSAPASSPVPPGWATSSFSAPASTAPRTARTRPRERWPRWLESGADGAGRRPDGH